jgi:hypothetical protein
VLARLAGLPALGSLAATHAVPSDADAASKSRKKQRKRKTRDNVRAEGPRGDGSPRANRCKKHRECCTGRCRKKKHGRGRCRCFRLGERCTFDQQCCPKRSGAPCQNGVCTIGQPCEADCPPQPCGDVCADGCPFQTIQEALDDPAKGTIRLCSGQFDASAGIEITRLVTISGAGQGDDPAVDTILDGGGVNAVMWINSPDPNNPITVTLNGLRFQNGYSGGGSGLKNSGGVVAITDCTFADNETTGFGGGILNEGTMTITDATVAGNRAGPQAIATCLGGGISNSGILTIANSVIVDNWAYDGGGGIHNSGAGDTAITNCTFVDNDAEGNGRDILNYGTIDVSNSGNIDCSNVGGVGCGCSGGPDPLPPCA